MSAPAAPAVPPARALVVKPSSFGDIIHTLPAARALRRAWPDADIRWLVRPQWAPLLEGNPDLNGVILFPREEFRGPAGVVRFVRWARRARGSFRPELAADFQGLLRSALAARLMGSGAVAGMSCAREGAGLFYTRAVTVDAAAHAVRRNLALAAALGGIPEPVEFPLPPGTPPAAAPDTTRPFFVIHPFSRGAGKSLSAAQAARLCAMLAPWQAVLVGAGRAAESLPANTLDLLGATSIGELIWLLRRAAAVVSVDSGPAHLAAALGTPLVALHTWSDPARVGPWSDRAVVWQNGLLVPAREFLHNGRRGAPGPPPADDTDLAAIARAARELAGIASAAAEAGRS